MQLLDLPRENMRSDIKPFRCKYFFRLAPVTFFTFGGFGYFWATRGRSFPYVRC